MNKKILSAVIAFLIILSSFMTVFAYKGEGWDDYWYTEDFENWDKSDVTEEEQIRLNAISENSYADLNVDITRVALPDNSEKALRIINFFKEIGILTQNYNVYDVITRAQAADIIAKLLSYQYGLELYNGTTFDDITPGDFASDSISYVHVRGIMNGVSEKIFAPDEYFYYNHAVTALVRMLGYENKAKAKGGYPTGYSIAATDLGILKGTNRSANTDLIGVGAFCTMLTNCFEVPMIDSYISHEGHDVMGSNDKTILKDCLGMVKAKGIVSAVENIDLHGFEEQLFENEIKINDVKYMINNKAYKQFLGMNVEFFTEIEKTNTNPEILYAEIADEVKSATIFSKDIEFENSSVLVSKEDEENKREFHISDSATILYNGIPKASLTRDILPKSGRVVLISNSGTKKADVVLIFDYEGFIAKGVSQTRVLFEYEKTINIDGKDRSYIEIEGDTVPYSILKDGHYIKLKDILQGSSVYIAYSDKVGYIIETCDEYVEGEVTEIYQNPFSVLIEDGVYKVDEGYLNLAKKYGNGAVDFDFGMYAKFILSPFGEIAGVTEAEVKGAEYGFVFGIMKSADAFSDDIRIKLYSISDNAIKEYDIAKNVTLNGNKQNSEAVYDEITRIVTDFNTAWQKKNQTDEELAALRNNPPIIKFKTFKKDVINTVVTNIIPYSDDEILQENNIVRHVDYCQKRLFQGYKNIERIILFDDTTTYALKIPDSLKEEDFISGRVKNVLPAGNDSDVTIVSFDSDAFKVPELILWYGAGGGSISTDAPIMIVENVSKGVNSDGEIVNLIEGISSVMEKTKLETLAEDDVMNKVSKLEKGDIISYTVTDKNEISDILLNTRYKETTLYNYKTELVKGNEEVLFGKIVDFNEKYFKTESIVNGALKTDVTQTIASTKMYFYDGEKIYEGDYTDMEVGDYMLADLYLTNLETVMVYKEN